MTTPSPAVRRYIYVIILATIPALLLARIITPEWVDVIINWVSAVLGMTAPAIAIPNTPKPND